MHPDDHTSAPSRTPAPRPHWSDVLRALREARGATQEGWAARLSVGRVTVQRWERGERVPDPGAEAAILAYCRDAGLFRPYDRGSPAGFMLSAELFQDLLAEARITTRRAAPGPRSVPNGIWDKPGPLNAVEWERVRLHAYQSERILARSALLEPYARVAGAHHERADGSGYHRGIGGSSITRPARLLAAADTYQAMTEPRAYRPARAAGDAARLLSQEARAGRLDREAVEAVLTAAGQRAAVRVRGEWPASLSEREVVVLCLVARGLPNKAIAAELTLSARTVQHHVEHIYAKTGVSTRAAAALFAVENDLLQKWAR